MSSINSTLTMGDLIEEVLDVMYRVTERPRQLVLTAAVASNDTSITVDSGSADRIAATDVLEIDRELMLATSNPASGVVNVSRGYAGTTAAAHSSGDVGSIGPDYPRTQVDREIRRAFQTIQTYLPLIETETVYPPDAEGVAEAMRPLDENTIDVLEVRYQNPYTTDIRPLQGRWEFVDWLPADVDGGYTGKALAVPMNYRAEPLIVTYQCIYAWTGSGDNAKVRIAAGGESLPSDFAAAKLFLGREVSRQEFDQIEEWNQVEAARRGQNLRMAQALWGRFYQRLDEVKGLQNAPRKIVYRRRPHRIGDSTYGTTRR